MPRKSVLNKLNLDSSKGMYCIYPFSKLNSDGKGCFKIGTTSTNFTDRFNQYFTGFPMGLYYVNFLINPTKFQKKKEEKAYYIEIENFIKQELEKHEAQKVVSRTGVTGKSEWWFTDVETIHTVFEFAEKKFGGDSIPYNLQSAFKHHEPKKDDCYFEGTIRFY
jgi:hypothetical protein